MSSKSLQRLLEEKYKEKPVSFVNHVIHVDLKDKSYDIEIEKGILAKIGEKIKPLYNGKKVFVVTDKTVFDLHSKQLLDSLKRAGFEVKTEVLEPGEKTKSLSSLEKIYNSMLDFKLTRSDLVIAFGGGVIGDLCGFAASTYLRGVRFVQIPTTLLAQTDSSVGGKVAVNLERGKNLVGSFYQPKAVYIDTALLDTLDDKTFADGMAEVIKYACIKDKELFELISQNASRTAITDHIDDVVFKCCDIKRAVVENDEFDTGERMLLNFGHTIGHAIEKYYNYEKYTHGMGVSAGMCMITEAAERIGLTKVGTAQRIKSVVLGFGLPHSVELENSSVILDTVALDKKNIDGCLNVILLKEIGDSYIHKTTADFFKEGNK